jgi:hypothetical protein
MARSDKRRYPRQEFDAFARFARRYVAETRHDRLLRRDVANVISRLPERLACERRRVPGDVLREADSLECLLFMGYDPHFEGDEPPDAEQSASERDAT